MAVKKFRFPFNLQIRQSKWAKFINLLRLKEDSNEQAEQINENETDIATNAADIAVLQRDKVDKVDTDWLPLQLTTDAYDVSIGSAYRIKNGYVTIEIVVSLNINVGAQGSAIIANLPQNARPTRRMDNAISSWINNGHTGNRFIVVQTDGKVIFYTQTATVKDTPIQGSISYPV